MNFYKESQTSLGGKLFAVWEKFASSSIRITRGRQRQTFNKLAIGLSYISYRPILSASPLSAIDFELSRRAELSVNMTCICKPTSVKVACNMPANISATGGIQ